MKIVVQHPTGNRNVRAVIEGLEKEGMLADFFTTIATNPKSSWLKLLPSAIQNEFLRRTYSIPLNQIHSNPLREFSRMILPKIGLKNFTNGENKWASIDSVYRALDRKVAKKLPSIVAKKEIKAVYAYEDGALDTFIAAKKLGLKCIYDLPIAYWETSRKLMLEEAERLPHWAITLGGGISDSQSKLDRKTEELKLADVIVGPGKFVIDSIPDWANNKVKITSPFGSPESTTANHQQEKKANKVPLRVLFAGSMSQRKGLGDLFSSFKLLKNKNVELIVMGTPLATMNFYKNEFEYFLFEHGRPNNEVLKLMQTCDVFCLPSIVEGRALVMQEAMSQGLPLIITENTGGADLIIEGKTGFLVPIRSPETIAEKIEWFIENRHLLPEMGEMSRRHAATYTWNNYQRNMVEGITAFLN